MTRPNNPLDQLRQRAKLVELIGEPGWRTIRKAYKGEAFEDWAEALDRLIDGGVRPTAVLGFARSTPLCAKVHGPETALVLASSALSIRKAAGDGALVELFRAAPIAARLAGSAASFSKWLAAIEETAHMAQESVTDVLRQTEFVLSTLDVQGFRNWILTAMRAAGGDPEARHRYLSLSGAEALGLLHKEVGGLTFSALEQRLRFYLASLWRVRPIIRSAPITTAIKPIRRSTFDEYLLRMPESFPGVSGVLAERLFYASVAHVGAHMVFTPQRFPVASLKPMQVALVSLIEDARVEALAMRQLPGLRRLWVPLHIATAEGAAVAPSLMARLSRALIDEAYQDPNPWVTKGREMFLDMRPQWDDARISRTIGSLLGNDLGQMRVQFNFKSYVVQPPYRDDNAGIWDFSEPNSETSEDAETITESLKIEQTEDPDKPHQRDRAEESDVDASRAARLTAVEDDVGIPVARLPEWDYASGRDRPEWTTIMEFEPRTAPPEIVDRIMVEYPDVSARISRLMRSARVSRPVRVRRQPDGERLDLDACISARIDQRTGLTPDPRVYESSVLRNRDLSILLLLDVSESTKDTVRGTSTSLFHIERAATALLASAMDGVGDPFAVRAFCSDTRHEVRYYRIKDFDQPYADGAKSRLGGLRGGYSTRIGAAIRQAGRELGERLTHRRLLLIVTDGEPSDVDVSDRAYLAEDARRAVQDLNHRGIDVFCVGLDSGGETYLSRIFGRRNVLLIHRVAELPEKLPMLYFRLTH
jgi:nitric oxide reductase NorD protein